MNAPGTISNSELHRQVERASLFTHTALGESFLRLGELQALVHGLADALLRQGVITEEDFAASVQQARDELQQRGELCGAGAVVRVDAEPLPTQAAVAVDCRSRLHVCKAVCCRLDFALSIAELEAGRVHWDLGRPYFIRHGKDGRCAHLDSGDCACKVYADRPQVCRSYNCTADTRIWKDFAAMELNQAWIDHHLSGQGGPRAVRVMMHQVPLPSPTPDTGAKG